MVRTCSPNHNAPKLNHSRKDREEPRLILIAAASNRQLMNTVKVCPSVQRGGIPKKRRDCLVFGNPVLQIRVLIPYSVRQKLNTKSRHNEQSSAPDQKSRKKRPEISFHEFIHHTREMPRSKK